MQQVARIEKRRKQLEKVKVELQKDLREKSMHMS